LAKAIGVDRSRIHLIVKGQRGISADTDLRLSRFFGLSEGFWLRLQNQYELREAKRKKNPFPLLSLILTRKIEFITTAFQTR
jgi:plasmid maintenance system antidote protein VapI